MSGEPMARRSGRRTAFVLVVLVAVAAAIAHLAVQAVSRSSEDLPEGHAGDASRGAYVSRLAGCVACHTSGDGGVPLAGGRRLETPFGTFVTPNITPSVDTGIGGWTLQQFHTALHVVSTNGTNGD